MRLAEVGITQGVIALSLGVSDKTFSSWLRDKPDFRLAFYQARTRGAETCLNRIRASCAGKDNHDWRASAWVLARMFPSEYGDPDKRAEREISLTVNNSVSVAVITPDRLREIQERRARSLERAADGRN